MANISTIMDMDSIDKLRAENDSLRSTVNDLKSQYHFLPYDCAQRAALLSELIKKQLYMTELQLKIIDLKFAS